MADDASTGQEELERLRRRVAALEAQLAAPDAGPLRAAFDTMFEGIQVVDPDGRYVYLNDTAARHGRRAPGELLGRRMADVYPGIDQTEMFAALRRCLAEQTPQQLANEFRYPDGSAAWFDLRFSPVPQGVLILSVDVSEQKANEARLRALQEDLAATLACMGEGVVTTDVEGRLQRLNAAAEALTAWPAEEARGRPFDEVLQFVDARTQAPLELPFQAILAEGLELRGANGALLVARDGTQRPVACNGAAIRDAQGAVTGVVLALRDMTEEHRLLAMFQQSQKMEAIGRLAGGVAHDFNNMLTVIGGYSELALGRVPEGDPIRKHLEQIRSAAQRSAALTRQLLAFSRRQVLAPEVLDLNAALQRMEGMLRVLLGAEIDLALRLAPALGSIRFDPVQIEQVVLNLAANARDAMPGGGRFTIETGEVELDEHYARSHPGASAGPHVMLAVSDNGTGMTPEARERLFEPFFTTKEQGKGTGLGLATVYGIVKQSGGNIWVYSELGHGTTFKVYIPRVTESAVARAPAPKAAAPRGSETILVVEDEDAVRELVRTALEAGGYRVLEARDGEEALALCERHEGPIDLLLADVVMPGMGGPEVAARVQALRPGLRAVYMSGYTDNAITRNGVLEPGTAFIEKPITPSTLLERLRRFLA